MYSSVTGGGTQHEVAMVAAKKSSDSSRDGKNPIGKDGRRLMCFLCRSKDHLACRVGVKKGHFC